jgi:hypothetical protein
MNKSSKKYFALLNLICFFGLESCKIRPSQISQPKSDPTRFGVDLMDLSIMYPSPMTTTKIGNDSFKRNNDEFIRGLEPIESLISANYWPKLVGTGDGFLTDALFNRAISPVLGTYSKEFGPSMFRFDDLYKLGRNYVQQSLEPENKTLNMTESKRWRIVSFVFNPCPYETHFSQSFDRMQKCTPEIRLVAQPAMGYTLEESWVTNTFPVAAQSAGRSVGVANPIKVNAGLSFGDYGMHLFYRLNGSAESAAVADQLYKLKLTKEKRCKTTGVPMGPHPCLVAEAKELVDGTLKSDQAFSTLLLKIMRDHTHSLHRISVWGSTQNAGPWGFYFGEIQNGDFVWKNIPTILPGTFSDSSSNSPFQAGKAMHYTRGSSITTRNRAVRSRDILISESKTLRPDPRPKQDSLQHFLLNQFRFADTGSVITDVQPDRLDDPADVQPKYADNPFLFTGIANTKLTGRYLSDLSQMTAKIDNPKINSELNVDCISCHLSKSEGIFARRNYSRTDRSTHPVQIESNSDDDESELAKTTDQEAYFWEVQKGYDGPTDLSNFTHELYQSHPRTRFGEVYILNQFSHYFKYPMVSSRSVNESSESARFVNEHFLAKPGPFRDRCNQDALRMCMLFTPSGDQNLESQRTGMAFPYSVQELPRVQKCKEMACNETFQDWSRNNEVVSTQNTQTALASTLKKQFAYAALRDGIDEKIKKPSKAQIDKFLDRKFNSFEPLRLAALEEALPDDKRQGFWWRIYSSSNSDNPTMNGWENCRLYLTRSGMTQPEYLKFNFNYFSKKKQDSPPNDLHETSAVISARGRASEAQIGNNHDGLVVTNEASNNLPVSLDETYRVQGIQNGEQLKLYAFNKYMIALEWPSGVREIYGNKSFVPDGNPPNFRHPSHMSESEIYQMFADEIVGK